MNRHGRILLLVTLGPAISAAAGDDGESREVRLRNNLTTGRLTNYRVARTIRRTATTQPHTLAYFERADWIRFNLDEDTPGRVRIAQLVVDDPAQVLVALDGERRIEPPPSAAELRLSAGSARLTTDDLTAQDAPAVVPACDAVQQTVLELLLDFAHWPSESRRAGSRWTRAVDHERFHGAQSIELVDVFRKKGESLCTITLQVEGEFRGGLAKTARLKSAAAVVTWNWSQRVVKTVLGQAEYERRTDDGPQIVDLKLDVQLVASRDLPDDESAEAREQLNAFAGMLDNQRAGRPDAVRDSAARFRAKWPDSVWGPAVVHLERQTNERGRAAAAVQAASFAETLGKYLMRWQAADATGNAGMLKDARRDYEKLADERRATLVEMSRLDDETIRATAVFALAFGRTVDNLALLQGVAANDASPTVRAWAVYGIALRRSHQTDQKLLAELLRHADANVRARACQAVAACIPSESSGMPALRTAISNIVLRDEADQARFHAADALAIIGTKEEIDVLERARKHEVDKPMRDHIRAARDRLKERWP